MSFTDQLVLEDEFGATITTFNLLQKDAALTSRVDVSSTAAQPRTLATSHTFGTGSRPVDRHNVSVKDTRVDSLNQQYMSTVSLNIVAARHPTLFDLARVRQDLQLLIAYLCDSHQAPNISSDNLAALLRGES